MRVDRKRKKETNKKNILGLKKPADICKGILDIECERDWSVSLGATLDDGQKIKNYFSSLRDFSGKRRVSHCWVSNAL